MQFDKNSGFIHIYIEVVGRLECVNKYGTLDDTKNNNTYYDMFAKTFRSSSRLLSWYILLYIIETMFKLVFKVNRVLNQIPSCVAFVSRRYIHVEHIFLFIIFLSPGILQHCTQWTIFYKLPSFYANVFQQ